MKNAIGKHIRLFSLFVVASFYFLSVDVLVDETAIALWGDASVMPIHLSYSVAQAAGFILFSVLQKAMSSHRARTIGIAGIYIFSMASLAGFMFAPSIWPFTLCSDICLFASGMIGASVYYYAAMELRGEKFQGRFFGIAIAAAACIQVIWTMIPLSRAGQAAVLTLALCGTAYLTLKKTPSAFPDVPYAFKPDLPAPSRRYVAILVAAVALISITGGINDGALVLLNAENVISLYAIPRVMYLVGVIVAGFIVDIRDGRYLPVFILAATLFTSVGLMFLDNAAMLFFNACVYSLIAGFAIMFFTVPFTHLAVRMADPALWAGMGRAVRLIFMIIGTILMNELLTKLPFGYTIALSITLSASLLVLFWWGGFLSSPQQAKSASQTISDYGEKHGFTDRENEILSLLYNGCTTNEIAAKLYISEKTVRNHISNMMTKSGVASRTELLVQAMRTDN